jgi:hypothetical protein
MSAPDIMDSQRAVTSGALVAVITAGVGFMSGRLDLMVAAMDGALMAASVLAADVVHLNDFVPSIVPPSATAGAVYAAAQAVVRGDNNYVINAAVGAAGDYVADAMAM